MKIFSIKINVSLLLVKTTALQYHFPKRVCSEMLDHLGNKTYKIWSHPLLRQKYAIIFLRTLAWMSYI
jgi:hypothetical protein